MKPDVTVDVGNTRIKWGRCTGNQVVASVSLPPEDMRAWQEQVEKWHLHGRQAWAISGVHPARRDCLAEWLRSRGDDVAIIDNRQQILLGIALEHPEQVGIDRLLNAVAAKARGTKGVPAIIADAGSAVTVDWLDETGTFQGGSIFPGIRLMARALHDHTALLPWVELDREHQPGLPGTSTTSAIEAGIFWTVVGGIQAIVERLASRSVTRPHIYLTGGDAAFLAPALPQAISVWPNMTLEGIRLAADTLP
jgi:type III pantothenate kinase